jgi:hypothetical protein
MIKYKRLMKMQIPICMFGQVFALTQTSNSLQATFNYVFDDPEE